MSPHRADPRLVLAALALLAAGCTSAREPPTAAAPAALLLPPANATSPFGGGSRAAGPAGGALRAASDAPPGGAPSGGARAILARAGGGGGGGDAPAQPGQLLIVRKQRPQEQPRGGEGGDGGAKGEGEDGKSEGEGATGGGGGGGGGAKGEGADAAAEAAAAVHSSEDPRPHQSMRAWLSAYFAQQGGGGGGSRDGRKAKVPPRVVSAAAAAAAAGARWRGEPGLPPLVQDPGSRRQACPALQRLAAPPPRRNLIVAPVGDGFEGEKWVSHPEIRNYDLVLIYFGRDKNFECKLCRAVYSAKGPKWRLMHALTQLPDWQEMARDYDAVMVADDDLIMSTCELNRVFDLFRQYKLLMAQPSVCDVHWTHTEWRLLYQNPHYVLRFTTFIEIMAPIFEMDFFQNVVAPSLYNAYTGWGLDFIWPFLLKYPRDKIAVIDDICIYHPRGSKPAGASLYSSGLPFSQREEESRRSAEYDYFESSVAALGLDLGYRSVEALGGIPREAPRGSALKRLADSMHEHLGAVYPLLLLAQTIVLCGVCLAAAGRAALLRRGEGRAALQLLLRSPKRG